MSGRGKLLIAVVFCLAIIGMGTVGFMLIDGYTFVEAFFMTVITISSVGYGEIRPLSDEGRIFTIFLILTGIGSLAYAGHVVVESVLERVWKHDLKEKKMKKRISKLKDHFIICGFGRVGETAVEHFSKAGTDFVIIEFSEEQCHRIREHGYIFLEGDATRERTLLKAGIKSASGLVALLETDPKNLFTVLTARELNPTLHIIARSADKENKKKIIRAGADNVISPYASAGRQVADDLLAATGKFSKVTEDPKKTCVVPQWIEVHQGSSMVGSTVENVCREMGNEILGLRRRGNDILRPDPHIVLEQDDMLLVFDVGESKDETEVVLAAPKKIVVIDDNPVIVRLYSRLFQRAGFHPLTADNGIDGLKLILAAKPEAAVVDYHMPGLSGIEICRSVRKSADEFHTLLVLFSGSDEPNLRKKALDAGADEVVLKSADASELVEAVINLLNHQ